MSSTSIVPTTKNGKLAKTSEATANGADDEIGDFQIRPSLSNLFPEAKVKDIIVDVMQQVLEGKEYTKSDAAIWSRQIVNDINSRIADLKISRYAHVVQITLMEQTGAGSRSIARCLWDASCDSTVSEVYKTKSMVCIVSAFGVFRY